MYETNVEISKNIYTNELEMDFGKKIYYTFKKFSGCQVFFINLLLIYLIIFMIFYNYHIKILLLLLYFKIRMFL